MKLTQQLICTNCQHKESMIEREFDNYFHGTISHSFRVQTCGNCGHHQMNLETIIRGEEGDPQLEFPPIPPVDEDPSLPSTISDPAVKRPPRKG